MLKQTGWFPKIILGKFSWFNTGPLPEPLRLQPAFLPMFRRQWVSDSDKCCAYCTQQGTVTVT